MTLQSAFSAASAVDGFAQRIRLAQLSSGAQTAQMLSVADLGENGDELTICDEASPSAGLVGEEE